MEISSRERESIRKPRFLKGSFLLRTGPGAKIEAAYLVHPISVLVRSQLLTFVGDRVGDVATC